MRRVPASIPTGGYGSFNPLSVGGRSVAPAQYATRGPALAREFFPDRGLQRIQAAALQAMQLAKGNPFADGNFFPATSFLSGTTVTIHHGLGRAYNNAMISVPLGTVARFKILAPTPASLTTSSIFIQADATCTADVWVY